MFFHLTTDLNLQVGSECRNCYNTFQTCLSDAVPTRAGSRCDVKAVLGEKLPIMA